MLENQKTDADAAPNACSECGARIEGGRAGCQALFNELGARDFSDPRFGAMHELFVDAYCMQHPEPYCHSAKSYAAHLTRLCCGLEFGGKKHVYDAIPRWLNANNKLEKPGTPAARGTMTIADVRTATTHEEYKQLVLSWAKCVWEAYASQHDLARRWLQDALAAKR
ncbi:MAG: DUF5946 family protein [Candidatus Acidiferrales bacterium]